MGISKNWLSFVSMTKAKADSHGKVAQYWDSSHNMLSLSLIVLSAMTTLSILLPITHYVAATLGAITTLVSAVAGSLAPSTRRQQHMESSKGSRSLMLKMVRVETEREYEELWRGYNKEMTSAPFLPHKYKVKDNANFAMTPEFASIVKQKENGVEEIIEELEGSEDFAMTPEFALIVEQKENRVQEMIEELEGSEAGDEGEPEVEPGTTLPEPQHEPFEDADNQSVGEEDARDDTRVLHQV